MFCEKGLLDWQCYCGAVFVPGETFLKRKFRKTNSLGFSESVCSGSVVDNKNLMLTEVFTESDMS